MLFRETVAVYCENHTEHTNILGGQIAEFKYCYMTPESRNSGARIDVLVRQQLGKM
jgi:hypothetical protein